MAEPLGAEFLDLPLQVGLSLLQHLAMPGVLAALKPFNYISKREAKAFVFSQPGRLFPRQARLCGGGSPGRLVLLRLKRLAFPAPSHKLIIALHQYAFWTRQDLGGDGEVWANSRPTMDRVTNNEARKNRRYSSPTYAYNATKNLWVGMACSSRGGGAAGVRVCTPY